MSRAKVLVSSAAPHFPLKNATCPAYSVSDNYGDTADTTTLGKALIQAKATEGMRRLLLLCGGLLLAGPVIAQQIDIPGPGGSGAFGATVAVLPNSNIVVTDPYANSYRGAVYLYSPAGTLINSLGGSTTGTDAYSGDQIGSGGITILTNGNFVISSPTWYSGSAAHAGAVTLVDGSTGLSGTVSAVNSLIGTSAGDQVGGAANVGSLANDPQVIALTNGNYVVLSPNWSNTQGAVTWGNGDTGVAGVVTSANSLVGSSSNDRVGFAGTPLKNGNYVICSPGWSNGVTQHVGAVTWGNGQQGTSGIVSATNSLVGSTANDNVGNSSSYSGGLPCAAALSNGNYVVASPAWQNGTVLRAGAVTWADGNTGISGPVLASNSLVGSTNYDIVGVNSVVALTNGNYVVDSASWNNFTGAATWANGSTGLTGAVSASNSLVGSTTGSYFGDGFVTALSNGNYLVLSRSLGKVAWGNGGTGVSGPVSNSNSFQLGAINDANFVTALHNGNFVAANADFNVNGTTGQNVGAVALANGNTALVGSMSASNSLVGTSENDEVGSGGVTALSNGNYVVDSPLWSSSMGAVTWANGTTGLAGTVSVANSLVIGAVTGDPTLGRVIALTNGNYVVDSPGWINGAATDAGAITWANGNTGLTTGSVSAANSLVGSSANDQLGLDIYRGGGNPNGEHGVTALSNGDYVVASYYWNNGSTAAAGAITLGRGKCGGTVGPINASNSVRGTAANGGTNMVFSYDAAHDQLVVGQPASNLVSLFKADLIFSCGFQ